MESFEVATTDPEYAVRRTGGVLADRGRQIAGADDAGGGPPDIIIAARRCPTTASMRRVANGANWRWSTWSASGWRNGAPLTGPGITRTTRELIEYWNRDGRRTRLFFAQREAAEAIIFLNEARADFLQGISAPSDEPSSRPPSRRVQGVPPARLQNGDRLGQDHRHGDARGVEHPEQGQRPLGQRAFPISCWSSARM